MTMKRFALLAVVLAFVAGWSFATEGGHDESIQQVTAEIRDALDLGPDDPIDADMVPPELLERLGDAVMGEIHPDAELHEWMDRMMGGEGSESLAAAHRWMGYRYLTGGYGPGGAAGGSMMGPGMMRGVGPDGRTWRWGMMGNPAVTVPGHFPFASPQEIVRRRYANGEITREEYLQMMEDLEPAE